MSCSVLNGLSDAHIIKREICNLIKCLKIYMGLNSYTSAPGTIIAWGPTVQALILEARPTSSSLVATTATSLDITLDVSRDGVCPIIVIPEYFWEDIIDCATLSKAIDVLTGVLIQFCLLPKTFC